MQPADPREWEDTLDGLEAHVAHAESVVLGVRPAEGAPWTPPPLRTPLPGHLVGRAEALLARLESLQGRVQELAERVRRERAVADRVSRATAPSRPAVYVDRTA